MASQWIARTGSSIVLSLPVVVWFNDCMYTTCRVHGASMEPALKNGDVLLVRRADFDFTGIGGDDDDQEETDRARLKRMEEAASGVPASPIISSPPLVLAGHVVVFRNPQTAFPHELNVKRVVGVGGQMVRPMDRFKKIENIPIYSLWVEGDNRGNSIDSGSFGPLSKKLLLGQVERVIWPPTRWSKLAKQAPIEGKAWWP